MSLDGEAPPKGKSRSGVQRRGEELRRHILFVAKDVFLEAGFERASMDTVSARAATSKRSLYAHFESKDRLFDAVLDLVRELYLGQLKTPQAYSEDPSEAVALFCGRFRQLMTWESQVRICRLSIAEAERLSGSGSAYYDAIFATTYDRLASYLFEQFGEHGLDRAACTDVAQQLLGDTVLPALFRALLGVDSAIKGADPPSETALARDVDMDAIRARVRAAMPV